MLLISASGSYGSSPAIGYAFALAGGAVITSVIPFGFGFVVARLDRLVANAEYLRHLQRLDPVLRAKLDAEASE
jgi:hypothetical protein